MRSSRPLIGGPPLKEVVASFAQPAGVSGVIYGAEWSPTLVGGTWTPVPDSGTGGAHVFSVPIGSNQKMFMRLLVTPQ